MKCPVCNEPMRRRWEFNVGRCWTGEYECHRCGGFHASGVIDGPQNRLIHWHPECPQCGLDRVVPVQDIEGLFHCCRCGRKIAVEGSSLVEHFIPDEIRAYRTHCGTGGSDDRGALAVLGEVRDAVAGLGKGNSGSTVQASFLLG